MNYAIDDQQCPIRHSSYWRKIRKIRTTDRWINFDLLAVVYPILSLNTKETRTENSGRGTNSELRIRVAARQEFAPSSVVHKDW